MLKHNLVLGATLIIVSEFMFASMAATIKVISGELPSEVIVFLRNFLVLVLLMPWLIRYGWQAIATENLQFHLVRSFAGVIAMYCFFYSIAHLPLASASLLKMTVPFFLPLIAFVWLREQLPARVGVAIGIGFIGTAVILQPTADSFSWVSFVALGGSAFAALAKAGIRRMSATESSTRIVFYFSLIGTLVAAIPSYLQWHTPDFHAWILLISLSVFGMIGQLLMTYAYSLAPSSVLGAFIYVSVIFSGLFGWWFWQEYLELHFLMGASLVILAGLLIMYRHQTTIKAIEIPLNTENHLKTGTS